ncbi:MAG: acyl-CoA thioesterase [Burkholderiaceae bacterium]|jgi:acyl-CoA hydrolase|nr:acyl-CoA thioesterase [Burkholderiaceae bacterium]
MTTPQGSAELRELVLPALANHHGTLFAGQGLQLMAKAAFLAARSLARQEVVMAGVSRVDFLAPVPVGHALLLRSWVSRVGRSSMTVCVTGLADLPGIPPEEALKGIFEMVAVDRTGRPIAIAHPHSQPHTETAP